MDFKEMHSRLEWIQVQLDVSNNELDRYEREIEKHEKVDVDSLSAQELASLLAEMKGIIAKIQAVRARQNQLKAQIKELQDALAR